MEQQLECHKDMPTPGDLGVFQRPALRLLAFEKYSPVPSECRHTRKEMQEYPTRFSEFMREKGGRGEKIGNQLA